MTISLSTPLNLNRESSVRYRTLVARVASWRSCMAVLADAFDSPLILGVIWARLAASYAMDAEASR